MKLFLRVMIFVTFYNLETFSRDFKNLKNAFLNILETLSKQDRMLTIVIGSINSDFTDAVTFRSTASIPRVIVKSNGKSKQFTLNSSTIVSLESAESVDIFNSRTNLSVTFCLRQQLFIYCRDGTFDKFARLQRLSHTNTPILQYEYFIVEEEKSIRLLTYTWC